MKTPAAHAVGYVTVAAMLPYLSIKTAWLFGSDVGVAQPGLMGTTPFVVGNLVTAAMEVVGAALALALVHDWGRRMPAWAVLLPLWVAGGLLGPVTLAAPIGFAAESLTEVPASDGLQGWVYALVYVGFAVQAIGLALAFALHVKARWGGVFRARLTAVGMTSRTREVQVLATVAVGVLIAPVLAVRLYWVFDGDRSGAQRALDGSSAVLCLAGLLGLAVLVGRRRPALKVWVPLTAAWLGTGAMFCSGTYQLLILLAPGTPFETTDAGGVGLVMVAQTFAGLIGATTGAFYLAEANHLADTASASTPAVVPSVHGDSAGVS